MTNGQPRVSELFDRSVRTSSYPDVGWVAEYEANGAPFGAPLLLAMGEAWEGPAGELRRLLAVAPDRVHGYQLALAGAPPERQRIADVIIKQHRLDSSGTMVALVHGGTRTAMRQLAQTAVATSGRVSGSAHLIALAPGWEYHHALAPAGFGHEHLPLDPVTGFRAPTDLIAARLRAARAVHETVVLALNPHQNPCGTVWTEQTVRAVVKTVAETGAWLLIDDAYLGLALHGSQEALSATAIAQDVLGADGRWFGVRSFGKQLGASGWAVGAAVGPEAFIDRWVHQVRALETYGVSGVFHWAVAQFLGSPAERAWTARLVDRLRTNRETVVTALTDIGLAVHAGADVPYVLFRTPEAENATEYCANLARSRGVVLTAATDHPAGSDLVRLYIGAASEVLEQAIERVRARQ